MEKLINEILDSESFRELVKNHPEVNIQPIYEASIRAKLNVFRHYLVYLKLPDNMDINFRNADAYNASLFICAGCKVINREQFMKASELIIKKANEAILRLNIPKIDSPF